MDVYVGDGDVVKMINLSRYGDYKNPNSHEWVLKSEVEALEQEVERLKGAIAAHNQECDFLCANDKHCDHRPRQCASCPKDWKVSI